jgi:hypothetical protein
MASPVVPAARSSFNIQRCCCGQRSSCSAIAISSCCQGLLLLLLLLARGSTPPGGTLMPAAANSDLQHACSTVSQHHLPASACYPYSVSDTWQL